MGRRAEVGYVLGLDLGSASLGWAVVALDNQYKPSSLIRTGVRIFQPGVEGSTIEIEQGKDKSRAATRRAARLHRRQLRRRAARQRDLFTLLQQRGLLPLLGEQKATPEQRHSILNQLDNELTARWLVKLENDQLAAMRISQALPYQLRKAALDQQLEPYELGRIFYHLIQRRGFKSNRRQGRGTKEKREELGKVKTGISELEQKIATAGARTLGEYLAALNPHEQKIRRLWTARRMYEDEFDKIWNSQQAYRPELLTAELKAEVAHLLFYQRPIASQEHLIGRCELEPDEPRSSWARLEAQEFRVLQKVNDLAIVVPGSLDNQPLTDEQREKVYLALHHKGDQRFAELRKLLELPGTQFNLERGGEKTLRGNRVNAHMRSVFGARWEAFSPEEKNNAVRDWATAEDRDLLVATGVRRWGLDELVAGKWAEYEPEDGYCSLSLKALRRLLPKMEAGMSFKTAEKEIYGERLGGQEPKDLLPTVQHALPALRNPAVERAVTEMRKVVNAIVREYGKPYEIHLEMARELRKSRKEREAVAKSSRNRQREREQAKARILRECGIQNPSRNDIEKALLFEECGGICPYTGRSIEFSALFGDPQFDVEHIIPLSRYPDDSFLNKTLCYHEDNRNVKRGRTPWEAYGADSERWAEILGRVKKFNNPAKLIRFNLRTESELEDFTHRQINDTRYTTRLAADLLGTLYGGRDEIQADGLKRRAIFATTGQVTSTLRKVWGLEAILREALGSCNGESKGKPRTDHRHHAIDAIVIALTSQRTVQLLSKAAAQSVEGQSPSRSFSHMQAPWPDFVDSVRPHIEQIIVSHRPEHKMSGALHKETIYGPPKVWNGKSVVHVRRLLSGIPVGQIKDIVDDAVREAVKQKLSEYDGDTKKFNGDDPATLPSLTTKRGLAIPIKRVRVREVKESLRELPAHRFVESDSIHHFELFVTRENGREYWRHKPVTLLEAVQRQQRGDTVVCHSFSEGAEAQFLFSLMKGDTVEIDFQGRREVFKVKKFYAAGSIWLTHANNAQADAEQRKDSTAWSKLPNTLKDLHPRKVVVDPLGSVHSAND
jgi:CRISPR-associated endonuclease Csn1